MMAGSDGLAMANSGGDVIVKPPGFSRPGMCTSSHWPGRNYMYQKVRLKSCCLKGFSDHNDYEP